MRVIKILFLKYTVSGKNVNYLFFCNNFKSCLCISIKFGMLLSQGTVWYENYKFYLVCTHTTS